MFKNKKILTIEILAILLILVIAILYWNSGPKDSGFYQNLSESEKECIKSAAGDDFLEKTKNSENLITLEEVKILNKCLNIK